MSYKIQLGMFVGFVLLAGCAHWEHPTASRDQLLRDDYECKRENYSPADRILTGKSVHTGMYVRCMELRGYRRTR